MRAPPIADLHEKDARSAARDDALDGGCLKDVPRVEAEPQRRMGHAFDQIEGVVETPQRGVRIEQHGIERLEGDAHPVLRRERGEPSQRADRVIVGQPAVALGRRPGDDDERRSGRHERCDPLD